MTRAPQTTPINDLPLRALAGAVAIFALIECLTLIATREIKTRPAAFYLPAGEPQISLAELIFGFAIATVFLILLLRVVKSRFFYTTLFGAVIAIAASYWFMVFLPMSISFLLAALIVLLASSLRRVGVIDLALVLGISGAAISLAYLANVTTLLFFLAIVSFYDIVAVHKTGHMIKLARGLIGQGAIFALILPPSFRGLAAKISEASREKGFFALGSGDAALPAAFAAAAARVSFGGAFGAVVGSIAGFGLLVFILRLQKNPRPMAALPPIAAGTILGYLIGIYLL